MKKIGHGYIISGSIMLFILNIFVEIYPLINKSLDGTFYPAEMSINYLWKHPLIIVCLLISLMHIIIGIYSINKYRKTENEL